MERVIFWRCGVVNGVVWVDVDVCVVLSGGVHGDRSDMEWFVAARVV